MTAPAGVLVRLGQGTEEGWSRPGLQGNKGQVA